MFGLFLKQLTQDARSLGEITTKNYTNKS